jgi:hypothetical protein
VGCLDHQCYHKEDIDVVEGRVLCCGCCAFGCFYVGMVALDAWLDNLSSPSHLLSLVSEKSVATARHGTTSIDREREEGY